VTLRPQQITRVLNAALPLLLVPLGLDLFGAWSLAASVPLALWLGCRGYRTRVVLEESAITVHGYLWSRRIPVQTIAQITPFPAVRWLSRRGRRRWTPVTAFADAGRMAPAVSKRNEWAFEQLTDWHLAATARLRRRRRRGPR
jgi:hypothetical protein